MRRFLAAAFVLLFCAGQPARAEFVSTYGENAAATFAEGLGKRIRNGEFSLDQQRQ